MHFFYDKGADMSTAQDVGEQAARVATPAAVAGVTHFLGIPLSDWVLILTIVYTLVQLFVLIRDRLYKPWRTNRDIRSEQPPAAPNVTAAQDVPVTVTVTVNENTHGTS
jgi:uncharacterized protein (DUF58 family)